MTNERGFEAAPAFEGAEDGQPLAPQILAEPDRRQPPSRVISLRRYSATGFATEIQSKR
jgi:hypothetical protein